MPLYYLARCGGACQHGRILGGRAGGGTHGLGGSPKAPPPVDPLPTHVGAGLSCFLVVSGVPCWLAPLGAGRAHGVGCRPTSDTRHHARAHPLGSLRRLAMGLDRLRYAYARPSCRPVGAARPPYPGFAPHPFYGGLLRRKSSLSVRHPLLRAGKCARAPSWVSFFSLSVMVPLSLPLPAMRSTHGCPAGSLHDALRAPIF